MFFTPTIIDGEPAEVGKIFERTPPAHRYSYNAPQQWGFAVRIGSKMENQMFGSRERAVEVRDALLDPTTAGKDRPALPELSREQENAVEALALEYGSVRVDLPAADGSVRVYANGEEHVLDEDGNAPALSF